MQKILIALTLLISTHSIASLSSVDFRQRTVDSFETLNREMSTQEHVDVIGLSYLGPCLGDCVFYRFVMNTEGLIVYDGNLLSNKEERRKGKIEKWEFENLIRFIAQSKYYNFQDEYPGLLTDMPRTYIYIKINGSKKLIDIYGGTGDMNLWVIERLIRSFLYEAYWDDK